MTQHPRKGQCHGNVVDVPDNSTNKTTLPNIFCLSRNFREKIRSGGLNWRNVHGPIVRVMHAGETNT